MKGNRYRWIILVLAWAALLLSAADRSLWATTAPVAGPDLGLSPALALGVFVTATQTGYMIALLAGSFATDWLGPRRMLTASILWLGLSVLGFSRAETLVQGMAAQFCIGVGAAPVFAIGLKLVVNWFEQQRRGTAISLFMTALTMPTILVNSLAPIGIGLLGWRGNYVAVGLLTLGFAAILGLAVRNNPADAPPEPPPSLKRLSPLPLLRSRDFRCIVIANMAAPCATWGFMIWANLIIMDRFKVPLDQSAAIVATYGLGGFAGLLLSGPLCERFGLDRRRATIGCFLAFALSLLLVGLVDDLEVMRVAVPLLGIVAYSYGPLLNTMLANAAGRLAASAAGMATILTFAAEGVQPLIIGGIYEQSKSFLAVCAALSMGPVIAAIAIGRSKAG